MPCCLHTRPANTLKIVYITKHSMSSGMPDIPIINWFYYIISPSSINSICSFGMFFDIICCLEQSYLSRQDLCAKLFAGSGGVKSAGNGGVVHDRLQVLHVHVFLAAPLAARHVAKSGAGQHQGGVAVRECPHHAGAAADLPVQPLDHVVGTDARPVLAGKITVGQRFLNAVLDLLGGLLQFHGAQLGNNGFRLLAGRFLALLGVDRLEHFCHNFGLGFGHNRENIAVEMHRVALVFGVRKRLAHGSSIPCTCRRR